jgi:glyoxylase-like metal-dependent hydrolase (beta-lactamase superfamily II)
MRKKVVEIAPCVYQVGGGRLSDAEDCLVYLVEAPGSSCLIDTGAGGSVAQIMDNMAYSGLNLDYIKTIIVTHGHIDHIGGLEAFKDILGAKVIAHRLELPAIEEGRPELTAAAWYGVKYRGVKVDRVICGDETVMIGDLALHCVHTPGHTPGSIAVYVDIDKQRILFGQDIHGPFTKEWGSDKVQWKKSMEKLLALNADILCEGHFGIYSPAGAVSEYIQGYLHRFSR